MKNYCINYKAIFISIILIQPVVAYEVVRANASDSDFKVGNQRVRYHEKSGVFYVISTCWDQKPHSDEEAVMNFDRNGVHFGGYDTEKEARDKVKEINHANAYMLKQGGYRGGYNVKNLCSIIDYKPAIDEDGVWLDLNRWLDRMKEKGNVNNYPDELPYNLVVVEKKPNWYIVSSCWDGYQHTEEEAAAHFNVSNVHLGGFSYEMLAETISREMQLTLEHYAYNYARDQGLDVSYGVIWKCIIR